MPGATTRDQIWMTLSHVVDLPEWLTIPAWAPLKSLMQPHLPKALRVCGAVVATPQVRSIGTVGGNVAHGTPGCAAVALAAIDAYALVATGRGCTMVPVAAAIGSANSGVLLGFAWRGGIEISGFFRTPFDGTGRPGQWRTTGWSVRSNGSALAQWCPTKGHTRKFQSWAPSGEADVPLIGSWEEWV